MYFKARVSRNLAPPPSDAPPVVGVGVLEAEDTGLGAVACAGEWTFEVADSEAHVRLALSGASGVHARTGLAGQWDVEVVWDPESHHAHRSRR